MNKIDFFVSRIELDLDGFDAITDSRQLNDLRDRINGLVLSLAPFYFRVADGKRELRKRSLGPETFQLFLENSKQFVKVRNLADKAFGFARQFHDLLCWRLKDHIVELERRIPAKRQMAMIDRLFNTISENRDVHYDILDLFISKIGSRWLEDPNNNFLKFLFDEMHERSLSYSKETSSDYCRLSDELLDIVDRILASDLA